ncbi:PLP-dependent aminotransferase family protein [Extensimonas sp. H3M7-6]|uniref:aminotransferase-like domain-containing protein n=1 Tax=Extensimonas soli TaxID=3031322 RepID=UPI0023DC9D80|nr:PLP-dependent aminotransferase family protein [Extensimonas sp. H3M7-6]MDF1483381.1 PLP-dependent aminotransferase family protein [Extensimonas sp. H3M7-6]
MPRQGTKIRTVMEAIRTRIAARTYPPDARLPSVRALAKNMQVSVSTVVEAYDRLAAEGVIGARAGSGFYVLGHAAPLALAHIGPPRERDVDPLWVSRQSLEAADAMPKPGCGWLPASWMDVDGLRSALRAVARADGAVLADYACPLGLPALRELLARRMAAVGIEVPAEQIMLTDSGTQALDMVCRFLLEPGDTVLVDDPCYFNFQALLRAHRVQVVGVAYTPQGPDIAAFAACLQQHAPRLYITNSGIHNPTGGTLSASTAHRLLQLAEQAGMVVVEDDIFADFEVQPAPRLAAFDGLARVIHIGSFSKTVSASLRCGYIAARADWIDSLVDLKIATSFSGGFLAAQVVRTVLTQSGYRKHLEALRARLARERDRAVERLGALGITPWLVPRAGMFLWCRLPDGIDAARLARASLQEGVVLAPGNVFSPSLSARNLMRFNVSQLTDSRVFDVLAQALHQMRTAP